MKKGKMLLILSVVLCLFALPAMGAAAGAVYSLMEESIISDVDLPESEELFALYADRQFYPDRQISFFGVQAGNRLTEKQRKIYDDLKTMIEAIASGERASTETTIDFQSLGFSGNFSAQELGVESITAENFSDVGREALRLLAQQTGLGDVLNALLNDCPYDLYWYDKTESGGFRYTGSASLLTDGTLSINPLIVRFRVAKAYQPEDYDTAKPEVDTGKTGAASAAAAKARQVVAENASKSDYDKLAAYRDYICKEVSYNEQAVGSSYTDGYGDPWQLIYVFDGNSETNVVCEGYAKAFQYLCDLTTFKSDIFCYSVSGVMSGGTGAGTHMWNIVTMEDGKNYLIDVTNSDSGTIGSQGGLFMDAPVSGGSISEGYTFAISGQGNISYAYDSDTKMMWGTDEDSILKLADSDYSPVAHNHDYVWVEGNATDAEGHTLTCKDCPDDSTITQAHTFTYSESNHVITVSCSVCSYEGGKLTLYAPTDLTYSGSAKEATYTSTISGETPTISYSGNTTNGLPVNAGDYTASAALGSAKASVQYTIAQRPATVAAKPQSIVAGAEISQDAYSVEGVVEGHSVQATLRAEGSQIVVDQVIIKNGDADVTANYAITRMNGELSIAAHTHSWTYGASDSVITATCGGEGTCSIEGGTATVTVSGGTHTYDGNAKQAIVTQDPENTFADVAVSYSPEPAVNAGNYTVTIALGGVKATDTLTIEQAEGAPAPTVTGNYALAESGDTYTYTIDAIEGAEYRMDDGAWQDSHVFTGIQPNSRHTFSARIKETNNVKAGATGTGAEVVFDKLPGSAEVSIEGWTYGEDPNAPVPVSSTNRTQSVSYLYESADGKNYSSEEAPTQAGRYKLTATFAANDTYGKCTATAEFAIAKAVPTPDAPTGLKATYGDTLGSVTLPSGWAWDDEAGTLVGNAGNQTFGATYTHPTEPDNYETVKVNLTIEVSAKTVAALIAVAEGTYVYNGKAHEPAVTVYDGAAVISESEYTVAYSDNVNVGTAKVIVKDRDGGNYIVSGEGTFAIVQSATDVTAQADKAEYTYGETITVTATGSAAGSKSAATGFALLRSLIAPANDQMALYLGDTQISKAVSADENGVYTMTYDTTEKTLSIGSHTLTVKYAGNDNMADASAAVKVAVQARELEIDSVTLSGRTYEAGNMSVSVEAISLKNVIAADDVLAQNGAARIADDDAGIYGEAEITALLAGTDARFYSLSLPVRIPVSVRIEPKTVVADVTLPDEHYTYAGRAIEPAVEAKDGDILIPEKEYTVSYAGNVDAGEAVITLKDAEGGNYVVSGEGRFTIGKARVTIEADSLSVLVGSEMPELTYRVTGLVNGDQLTVKPTISCEANMEKAGTYTIGVSGADAGANYEVQCLDGVLYVVTADEKGATARTQKKTLTEVPPGLQGTPFDTVDKIVEEMTRTLIGQAQGYTAANMEHYDVKLQFSVDGGKTWIDATEANFPSRGIRIHLDYPKGTGRYSHDFVVSHMFTVTSDRLNTTAGDTEQPTVTKLDDGIEVTLRGLSPVSIAWKASAKQSAIDSLPQTGDNSRLTLWIILCVVALFGAVCLKRMSKKR